MFLFALDEAMIPPLAVVQARMGSKRLPNKMMLPLAGRPLIWYAWRKSVEAFGEANVVVAIPASPENEVLRAYIADSLGGHVFRWPGEESDVLGRFYACASSYRWHPQSVIVRVTAEDFQKDAKMMQRVAWGERLPVEQGAEAFTLEQLLIAHAHIENRDQREHITHALFATPPPLPPEGLWSIDSEEDYEAAKLIMEAA